MGGAAKLAEVGPSPPDLGRMGAERLARLRDQMQAQGVDGAVLLHGPNVGYATGYVPEAVDASHANHRRAVAVVSAGSGPARLHAHDSTGEAAAAGADLGERLWPELDEGATAVGSAIAEVLGDVAGPQGGGGRDHGCDGSCRGARPCRAGRRRPGAGPGPES